MWTSFESAEETEALNKLANKKRGGKRKKKKKQIFNLGSRSHQSPTTTLP